MYIIHIPSRNGPFKYIIVLLFSLPFVKKKLYFLFLQTLPLRHYIQLFYTLRSPYILKLTYPNSLLRAATVKSTHSLISISAIFCIYVKTTARTDETVYFRLIFHHLFNQTF